MSLTTSVSRLALCVVLLGVGAVACGGDDDGGGGSSSAFCDKVRELDEFEFEDESDTEAFTDLLQETREAAPSEIEDDVETVFTGQENGETESDEYKKAEKRLDTYVKDECGIDTSD